MSYNDSLDDLGDAIDAIIDHAVNSRDFQHPVSYTHLRAHETDQ